MSDYSERLRASDYEVKDVDFDLAKSLVRQHHYSKATSNTATYRHGLFRKGNFWQSECLGVAIWIPPTKTAAFAAHPENWKGVLALSRLVIVPNVPKNACTFLLARSVRLIDKKLWPCLLTYADEWQGHTGTIYKAAGWTYTGKTGAEPTYVLNGAMISRKAGANTRTHQEMLDMGAAMVGKHAKHRFVLKRI